MPQPNDLSRSLAALDQESTLIAVVEMSQSSWLVAGMIPGVERHPAKKLEASEALLLSLLHRWREEATKVGRTITRIAVAFEAGRDGFWLARWLRARGIEAHVIHATSIAVSLEHRRAKTDRLDAGLLKRAFLGWLRGERDHYSTAALHQRSDRRDRGRAHRTAGAAARPSQPSDRPVAGAGNRRRDRDGRHAGSGGAFAAITRPQAVAPLWRTDRIARGERRATARERLGQGAQ
jgi:hypothetical protein